MPRSAREVPREIAAFGERQFKETGAMAVEVLRVKAAVLRKHFRELKGIVFLVAVIARDRVRIYFFNSAGMMLVGENVEPIKYQKVRASSKLIAKYEKPKELTPEEQRIEATQELRDSLAKAIRRVTRFLNSPSPLFPDIFITRTSSKEPRQDFGLQITDDGVYLFEDTALETKWTEGLINRTAFLAHIRLDNSLLPIASVVGNGVALALMKDPQRKIFRDFWVKNSQESEWLPFVNHLIKHIDSYSSTGFVRLLSLLNQIPDAKNIQPANWRFPFEVIHDNIRVSIGTEEYHVILKFCRALSNVRKLNSRKQTLESIHLSPRIICDPTPLDIQMLLSFGSPSPTDWGNVTFMDGSDIVTLKIGVEEGTPLTALEYWLNLEDVYPSSGGLVSHGKNVIQRAMERLGFNNEYTGTFEASLSFSNTTLETREIAVLERLTLGRLDVLSNTMIGSPKIVDKLLCSGRIVLLPSFNHIGVDAEFLLKGEVNIIRSIVKGSSLEATTFITGTESIAVVSAPSTWRSGLIDSVKAHGISLFPILSITSERNILRDENPFPRGEVVTWTDSAISPS